MEALAVLATLMLAVATAATLPAHENASQLKDHPRFQRNLDAAVHGPVLEQPASASKTPSDLIRAAGYPAEAHHVTTSDGYVLRLDRIPRLGATPVYLAHTLFTSSAIYLILGKHNSLGFLLYDAGFDVWLANYRGTFLSLNHTHLSSTDDDYWKFGWQENGALDNPAMIDYIVATTGKPRVVYFGHSLGSTTFFSMASDRPDMLDKVEAAFLCAPPVFLSHSTDASTKLGGILANVSQVLIERLHQHELPQKGLRNLVQVFCTGSNPTLNDFCLKTAGMDKEGASFLLDMAAFFPSGGSTWQVLHYAQLYNPKWPGFRKFNYGSAAANRARYGTDSPPDFSLKHIDTPVYMYNGLGDTVCSLEDLALLRSSLPNVRRFFFSPNAALGHRDFVLSLSAVDDVWRYMLPDMAPYLSS